tara:strand:+ start:2064 stop:3443 length:1380 start_codon:yes stop_codon:yes gene_type:complete
MVNNPDSNDIARFLEVLPPSIEKYLSKEEFIDNLLEVVLDLGRLAEARFPNKTEIIGKDLLNKKDLDMVIKKVGDFGKDNRAGIEKTLHRISAIRNRKNKIVGLTCRVGRAVSVEVELISDLIEQNKSILLMGPPGVGKTTALREIARILAEDIKKRVVIIDTSNEIGGDGDVPHPSIGRARRMQVSSPEYQHQVMIEAVENHMPEVIVIDEIGTELETLAARTIAERGVQLIGTAHGNSLDNLIKNPTLCDLIGGIKSVTLGDDEARRRKSQKTILERAAEPTFPIAIEIINPNNWSVHKNVANTVDISLRGEKVIPDIRKISNQILEIKKGTKVTSMREFFSSGSTDINDKYISIHSKEIFKQNRVEEFELNILCHGIDYKLINESINLFNLHANIVLNIENADVILTVRNGFKQNQSLRKKAKKLKIPIYVLKSQSISQIKKSIQSLVDRYIVNRI